MPYNPKIHRRCSIRLPNYDYSRPGAYFVTICVQGRTCLFGDVVDGEMRLNDAGVMVNRWYNGLMRKFDDIACDAWMCMPNHVHFIVINTGHACPYDDSVGADLCVRPVFHTSPVMGEHMDWSKTVEHVGSFKTVEHVDWSKTGEHVGSSKTVEHVGSSKTVEHVGSFKTVEHVGSFKTGEHVGSFKTGEHVGSPLRRVVQWFKTMSTNEYIRGVKQQGWQPFFGWLWQRNYWEHIVRDESELNRIREYIASNPVRWEMDRLHPEQGLRETPVCYGIGCVCHADDADWMA